MAVESREMTAPQFVGEGIKPEVPPIRGYFKHGNVSLHDSPYTFEVNVDRFAELLRTEFNLPPELIGKIEIRIVGEGKMSEMAATREERKELFPFGNPIKTPLEKILGDTDIYAVKNDEVKGDRILFVFYPFLIWKSFNRDKRAILAYVRKRAREQKSALSPVNQPTEIVSIAKKREELENQTEIFSISKRMAGYLDSAPVDRVEEFLDKQVARKVVRDILRWVAHETDHVSEDNVEKKNSFLNRKEKIPIFINNFLYFLARYISRVERFLEERANNAEDRIAKKSQWIDVIEFKVNKKSA